VKSICAREVRKRAGRLADSQGFRDEAYVPASPPRDASPSAAHVLSQFPRLSTDLPASPASSSVPDPPEPFPGARQLRRLTSRCAIQHPAIRDRAPRAIRRSQISQPLCCKDLPRVREDSLGRYVQALAAIRYGLVRCTVPKPVRSFDTKRCFTRFWREDAVRTGASCTAAPYS
jgi:hypothetical protein